MFISFKNNREYKEHSKEVLRYNKYLDKFLFSFPISNDYKKERY